MTGFATKEAGIDMRGQRGLTVATVIASAMVGAPALGAPAASSATDQGRLVELGTLSGGYASAHAVNGRGDIIGFSTKDTGAWTVTWPHNGRTPIELQVDGGRVAALNGRGDVVGTAHHDGFRWHDGQLTLLDHPVAAVRPAGINAHGQVVGELMFPETGGTRAFSWQRGVFTELPTPAGRNSAATAVNDRGQVLGVTTAGSGGHARAVLWQGGPPIPLPPSLDAVGLNNRGQVLANGGQRPYLWQGGRLRDLLAGTGRRSGTAVALNDAGDVLVHSGRRSFLWRAGRIIDIDAAGRAARADFLNDRGDVAGVTLVQDDGDPPAEGFRWGAGRTTFYTTSAGVRNVVVKGLDNQGRIVGEYWTADDHTVVFRSAS
jgi:uncharacterized membrane protein